MVIVTQEVIYRPCFKISSGIMVPYNSPNESSYRKKLPMEYLDLPLHMALEKNYSFKPVNLSDSNIWITLLLKRREGKS